MVEHILDVVDHISILVNSLSGTVASGMDRCCHHAGNEA